MIMEHKKLIETIFYEYLSTALIRGLISESKDLHALASLMFTLYAGLKVVSKIAPNKESLLTTVDAALSLLD